MSCVRYIIHVFSYVTLVLGWGSEVSCPRYSTMEEDPYTHEFQLVTITKTYFIKSNFIACDFFDKNYYSKRDAESAEQDQPARMCRLILLYTLRKINAWFRTGG